jgi:hypothetical protein
VLFQREPKKLYALFIKEAAETLLEIGADPKHLGALMGATAVLHTWKRDLGYHPHVHIIVPGGGLAYDAAGAPVWKSPKKADYLLPTAVLATRLRNRMRQHFQSNDSEYAHLRRYLPLGAWEKTWNVNITSMGDGEKSLRYLARYVQSTAIRNSRILACDAKNVTYSWTDRKTQKVIKATVSGEEFLRRFLRHILPKSLMRVRHYGYLSAAAKNAWTDVRRALRLSTPASPPQPPQPEGVHGPSDKGHRAEAPTDSPPDTRPCCGKCRQAMEYREYRTAHETSTPEGLRRANQQPGPAPIDYEWNRPRGRDVLHRTCQPRGPPEERVSNSSHAPGTPASC